MASKFVSNRTRLTLLFLGALAGLIAAATGLITLQSPAASDLPEQTVARVGDRLIPEQRYLALIQDLETDKRTPLSATDRSFALQRLIDEELLIMRGIELGLPESSPLIRKAIAAALIAQLATEAEADAPDESDLRELYEADPDFFTRVGQYRLRWIRIPGNGAAQDRTAQETYRQLTSGTALDSVLQNSGVFLIQELPDALLPVSKLADYLGPDLARRVPELSPGEYSIPVATDQGFHILHLLQAQAEYLPPFETLKPALEAEYLRRAGDQGLQQYLQWLRQRADIIIDEEKLQ